MSANSAAADSCICLDAASDGSADLLLAPAAGVDADADGFAAGAFAGSLTEAAGVAGGTAAAVGECFEEGLASLPLFEAGFATCVGAAIAAAGAAVV